MINVSIVDDEKGLRESIATFVNGSPGFRCISNYSSGEAALKGLPEDKPDVVLMDINLGGMTGIECVERLKTVAPDMQILMLTVYEDTDQIFKALEAGATGYLAQTQQSNQAASGHSRSSRRRLAHVQLHRPQSGRLLSKSKQTGHTHLSPREEMVLNCLAKGLTYKQIADQLDISIDTIRTYLRRVYEKLHVQSRTEAVAKYLSH